MFLIDLMHEVEIGSWKALFIHLLRILASVDESTLHELEREASNSEPLTSADHTKERDISETRVSAETLPGTSSMLTVVPLPGSHPPKDSACRDGHSGCRSRHPRGIRKLGE
jgi:hypothetical protein